MTMQRTIKLYRLPEQPKTPGFRKLTEADCPQAYKLLVNVLIFMLLNIKYFNSKFSYIFSVSKKFSISTNIQRIRRVQTLVIAKRKCCRFVCGRRKRCNH